MENDDWTVERRLTVTMKAIVMDMFWKEKETCESNKMGMRNGMKFLGMKEMNTGERMRQ
ncbi:MAG TPA: hypothetical protein H9733_02205 [Candidatus Anaerotignum merdipullorum]|nr:hypothetical protein [Candidatus Anaerotignum merdipullorum]